MLYLFVLTQNRCALLRELLYSLSAPRSTSSVGRDVML